MAAQIRNSGYQDKLLAGIVISGAASNVKNLDKAASVRLHPDKTRFARIVPFALQAVHAEQVVKDGSLNTLLALMNEGNQNCVEPKVVVKEEVPEEVVEEKDIPQTAPSFVPVEETHKEVYEREEPKNKGGIWKKFKEKLVDLTKTVTEE